MPRCEVWARALTRNSQFSAVAGGAGPINELPELRRPIGEAAIKIRCPKGVSEGPAPCKIAPWRVSRMSRWPKVGRFEPRPRGA